MREIKYQAFISELGECREVEYLHIASEEVEVRLHPKGSTQLFSYSENKQEAVLRQYTGLKDKNGQEIYERDIVSQEFHGPMPLEYQSFGGVVAMLEGQWVIDNEIDYCIPLWSEINENEVVGNIYKNPKLKEEK